ncbi:anti-sigma factor [Marisediminicola antarctica]|uniref:anti-sigma factor n=1 Tax=Marisediminicola antarctica TaxID=674079 RepID=UPI00137A4C88|nr:anti-sigma factor [Marisediminicola antarctica]
MTERDELHLLTGAYALNALDESERAAVDGYLAESEEARTEVTELSDTAVMLGLASPPVTPSPEFKANLMALISTTPQLGSGRAPHAEAPHAEAPHAETDAAVTPLVAVALLPTAEADAVPTSEDQASIREIAAGTTRSAEARAQARWYRRPMTMLLAAAAAVALFAGGAVVGQQFTDANYQNAMAQAASLAELTAAPDVERSESSVSGGGTATLVWSESLQRSAMMFDSLPELTGDLVYQLWYIGDAGAVSAGTFSASSEQEWRILEGSIGEASAVGMSVEPQGGSAQPTTTPIVVIEDA